MSKHRIGKILKELDIITQEQFDKAIEILNKNNNNEKLKDILLRLDYITEKDLLKAFESKLHMPVVDITDYVLKPHLSQYIPEDMARKNTVIPLELANDNVLEIATFDPYDLEVIDNIKLVSGLNVKVNLATAEGIKSGISQIYLENEEETQEIFNQLNNLKENSVEENNIEELREMTENAPIIKLTNMILTQAINRGVSDVHIEPQKNKLKVRYRIDGVLHDRMTIPKHIQMAFLSRIKILANLDITQRRIPQDGRVSIKVNGLSIDMRVSTIPTIHGEKIVLRLFSHDTSLLDINKLGFREYNLDRFKEMIKQPNGIILVTGPTGSGKTTTLFAALKEFNAVKNNIITIEDPVEYKLNNINQIQTNKKTGLNFSTALRSILRQDPDIVMIGEIRDKETAEIAIRAALTGHLVLSTIHTNDAVSSIMRLVDMDIPPYLIASSLVGIISQRLVRRVCDKCKTSYISTEEEKNHLEQLDLMDGELKELYKGEGCKFCNETGYKGRIPILESLIIDEKIENMIMEGVNKNQLQEESKKQGLVTLKNNGLKKVVEGITTYEEIMKTTFTQ